MRYYEVYRLRAWLRTPIVAAPGAITSHNQKIQEQGRKGGVNPKLIQSLPSRHFFDPGKPHLLRSILQSWLVN